MQIRLQIRLPGLRSNPHWAARHKPANPPSSTQCLARNASNPLELASEQETMNLPTARHPRASRARIARASRPHRTRGGGGAPARRARFVIIITPATSFFAVLPPRCGHPRPHVCVPPCSIAPALRASAPPRLRVLRGFQWSNKEYPLIVRLLFHPLVHPRFPWGGYA